MEPTQPTIAPFIKYFQHGINGLFIGIIFYVAHTLVDLNTNTGQKLLNQEMQARVDASAARDKQIADELRDHEQRIRTVESKEARRM